MNKEQPINDGWKFDYDFLKGLTKKVNDQYDESLSMEEVECVLLGINYQTPIAEGEERLLAEIAELKAWKESAMFVMSPMREIGKALEVKLGESIHDKILPGIERLKGLIEKAFDNGFVNGNKSTFIKPNWTESWEQFKTENNLL